MSEFTTQVRTLVEHYSQETPNLPLKEQIEIGRKKFFDFDYPFFDEDYKEIFETNFLKYFYMYEIGQETEGLFKFRLDTWLNTNMFYYNKLFESEQLAYNPIENTNLNRNKKRNNNVIESDINLRKGKANSNHSNTNTQQENQTSKQTEKENQEHSENEKTNQKEQNFNRELKTDTPENRLQITTGNEGTGVIEYASSIDENKSYGNTESSGNRSGESSGVRSGESSGNRTGESNGKGEMTTNMLNEENRDRSLSECETESDSSIGKTGSITYQEMIQLYRETFLNVERKIFENMRKDGLFMLIYN